MFDTISSKDLITNGIAVAILVPVLAFFFWAGRAIVLSLVKHIDDFFHEVLVQQKEVTSAIKDLSRSYSDIRANCLACRMDSIATLKDAEERIGKRATDVAWAVHDKAFAEMKSGFESLEKAFVQALTNAANSIREGNAELVMALENKQLKRENEELSRPYNTGAVQR
jgi:hypothetical protein